MTSSRDTIWSVSVRRLPLARLGESLRGAESGGANEVNVDICDGTFAPGFSLGFEVVEAIRDATTLPIHVHLQAERPERFIADLSRLGCAALTVPIEACTHAHRAFAQIRDLGMKSGASVNPGTALTTLEYVLPLLDRVVLPVDEGGPADREPPPAAFERVRILRENIDYHETGATIFAEGDLNPKDAARMLAMGANGIVIDRKDVLGVAPFEASLREFIDTATRARKTA